MSDEAGKTDWGQYWKRANIHVQHAIGSQVQIFGDPGEYGNWLLSKDVQADKRHDFVLEFNGEYFELTAVEMLEALRAHAAARVIKGERG